ncbi:hypothetical protein C4D60_Mb01t03210 [Musa balbisiana]|uniref:Uncharacterized protein n=1 Tax=Musa balbisiana TaxID=52838 RepID=A0A4S8JKB3_MUSBA|nr:hypothetical protein C4D60_Mb01t03210 [Musa balbisiana]
MVKKAISTRKEVTQETYTRVPKWSGDGPTTPSLNVGTGGLSASIVVGNGVANGEGEERGNTCYRQQLFVVASRVTRLGPDLNERESLNDR